MTSPRLLLLTPDFPPVHGGIQQMLAEGAAHLSDRGWRVTVVAPSSPGAEAWDRSAPFAVVRTRATWGPRSAPAVLAEMLIAALRIRSDVVLAGHVAVLPPLLVSPRGAPVAAVVHGSELWSPQGARLVRRVRQRVARFVAVSEFTRGQLEQLGVASTRIRVAHNGGDAPTVPPDWRERLTGLGLPAAPEAPPFLLTIARLAEPHKGQDVVLRALPALVARHPGLRYVVAGDGPLRAHLRRIAATSGVGDALVMTGSVDEPTKAALLAGCRAVVLLSREAPAAAQFEGFGIALVEAAFARRPVIAGRSGGIPEVVRDRETGLLVDPTSPVAFAEAASTLVDDSAYADALGERAQARAQSEFTWTAAGRRMEGALADLVVA